MTLWVNPTNYHAGITTWQMMKTRSHDHKIKQDVTHCKLNMTGTPFCLMKYMFAETGVMATGDDSWRLMLHLFTAGGREALHVISLSDLHWPLTLSTPCF
jgi:hypothetical protein